jgi:hypothetical protein
MTAVAAPPAIQTALVARSGSEANAMGVHCSMDSTNAAKTALASASVMQTKTKVARGHPLAEANGALTGLVRLEKAIGLHIAR